MAESNLPNLRTRAQQIKDETIKKANTATRVGGFLEDFVDTIPAIVDGQWEFYLDSVATEATKVLITGGQRYQATIDGGLANLVSNTGITRLWNTGTNRIQPISGSSFILVRFAMHAESTGGGTNYFDVELDVSGGTFPVIWEQTGTLIKGAGVPQSFNFNMFLFVGDEFLANGGAIYISPLSDILVHELAISMMNLIFV